MNISIKFLDLVHSGILFPHDMASVKKDNIRAAIDVIIKSNVKIVAQGTIFGKVSHALVSMRKATILGGLQG